MKLSPCILPVAARPATLSSRWAAYILADVVLHTRRFRLFSPQPTTNNIEGKRRDCAMSTLNTRPVQLPLGEVVVRVSMINPVRFGPVLLERFMAPPVPGLETFDTIPSLSFLLEHPSGRKLVWDLGIRKDYHNYAPDISSYIPTTKYKIDVTKNVADILQENGVDLHHIEAVVWRLAPRPRNLMANNWLTRP